MGDEQAPEFHLKTVGGSITPSGALEVEARKAQVEERITDAVQPSDSLEAGRCGEVFAVRKEAAAGRRLAVDLHDDQSASSRTTGMMRKKADRELQACSALVEFLNRQGANWAELTHTGHQVPEPGYDCVATWGSRKLRMQHTQAIHDPSLGQRLAVDGAIEHGDTLAGLARALWLAIQAKLPAAKSDIALVLDASDVGALSLPAAVAAF